MLVGEDVVPQMKRLQRKACEEQNQDCDMGESWMHGPQMESAADHGQYTARYPRASGTRRGAGWHCKNARSPGSGTNQLQGLQVSQRSHYSTYMM